MADISENTAITPQCHYFVVRKKRLCRMTVRPGRQYCGEHEPKPKTEEGQDDMRIPCPYDSKHTCYASKLEKHLSICNAKQTELPPYIIHNINAPTDVVPCVRRPLSEIPKEALMEVIEKVINLYETHIKGKIVQVPERPIHPAVIIEFSEGDRTESSRRHMRQASSILHLAEKEGLVQDGTCYIELGAGKGQLSYYMGTAWCDALTGSTVLAVDRAAPRHKRDNKLGSAARIRADLAHLSLARESVASKGAVAAAAKHLCGVATDYALRCVTADDVLPRVSGIVLATCCHHRCEQGAYVANRQLQELGITGDDLNAMLGIVSWATCGDGRSRERRRQLAEQSNSNDTSGQGDDEPKRDTNNTDDRDETSDNTEVVNSNRLEDNSISINEDKTLDDENNSSGFESEDRIRQARNKTDERDDKTKHFEIGYDVNNTSKSNQKDATIDKENDTDTIELEKDNRTNNETEKDINDSELNQRTFGDPKWREEVGRKAKALLDWGRLLYLKEKGFNVHLCYYVPATVSLENVCIVASKKPDFGHERL